MGYGRVNACLAVIKASILKNVPIQAICTQQWTFGGFPLPAGVSISWTSSNPSGFQIDASGLATRFSNFSGAVTITATVTGGCGTMTISSSVYVGIPDRPGPVTGNTSPNVGYTEFYFSSPPATGATSYDWILPYNSGWSIDHYNDILSIFAIVGSGQGFVQAVSRNACGTGGAAKLYVTPVGNGGCNPCQIVINPNPNPADKDLHVGLGEGKEEKKVSLINSSQETVISLVTFETTIVLPTSALPEGVYYLRITRNDQMFEHRIVIKH